MENDYERFLRVKNNRVILINFYASSYWEFNWEFKFENLIEKVQSR